MGGVAQKCCAGADATTEKEISVVQNRGGGNLTLKEDTLEEDLASLEKPAAKAVQLPEQEAAVDREPGQEFTIIVDKATDGGTLGVDVDLTDGKCLLIESISGEGIISNWNKNHPDQPVRPRDAVVEVNGKRGNAQELARACLQKDKLEIVLRTGR
mmetsp:Transcript_73713/g.159517  ORF Transcript_73713/g.159517 Transcript_73713/m.159517 type:complete len:156 (+) Transcript_73713:31-498(+)|eukprot:CAMPEP_0170638286 /NCGR_PEP_ID=MMETSP0224-20130122/38941_1 /TAXON_ID=285029 /ORGANISM="Togula jolla, Strain CCCM 725" /LENGTH=155 /DNA_ID=CAMNT_0010968377 /DNA_START=26 /DNA_END=493 /DNA_ORIENTATION=-